MVTVFSEEWDPLTRPLHIQELNIIKQIYRRYLDMYIVLTSREMYTQWIIKRMGMECQTKLWNRTK